MNELKIQNDTAKRQRSEQEAQLEDMMRDFEDRKDIELKAKMEVDEINK